MLRRHQISSVSLAGSALAAQQQVRHLGYPGWEGIVRNKKTRDKDERDAERKERQVEKLPDPTLLPDHHYPSDKQVIADTMFQPTVYKDHLDTPDLFDFSKWGSDFILNFDVSMFNRTEYPDVPEVDTRKFAPGTPEFDAHSRAALDYGLKHSIVPDFVPHQLNQVNLSVVFQENANKKVPAFQHEDLPPTELTNRNYWMTAHCGNYIELCNLVKTPSFFLSVPESKKDSYYTVVLASPDYPFRTQPHSGFYVQTVVANVQGQFLRGDGDQLKAALGDVVIPYTPPLPHEGAGTARTLCMVFEQEGGKRIEQGLRIPSPEDLKTHFPFPVRANYRFHNNRCPDGLPGLQVLEGKMNPAPVATTFFQTTWDIQTQEFYEEQIAEENIAEPNYIPEGVEDMLKYNARASDADHVKTRRLEDGSMNEYHEWGEGRVNSRLAEQGFVGQRHQSGEYRVQKGVTMMNSTAFSRKTYGISKDGKYFQLPNDSYYGYAPVKESGRQY